MDELNGKSLSKHLTTQNLLTEILGPMSITSVVVEEDGLLHEDILEEIKGQVRKYGIKDAKLTIARDRNKCPNFLSTIATVKIEGWVRHVGKVVLNWLVKSAPKCTFVREEANIHQLFIRESYIYKDLFPRLKEMENGSHIIDNFDNFPLHIFSSTIHNKETVIVMDVRGSSFIHKKCNEEPWDMKHVKVVLKALAKYHAFFYVLKQNVVYDWTRIIENTQIVVHSWEERGNAEADKYVQTLIKRLQACLIPEVDSTAISTLKTFTDNFLKIMESTYDLKTKNSVVIHGDCWMNNILFKYGNTSKSFLPTEACLVDWQHARHSSPACDLTTLIFCTTEKTVRDEYYDTLIRLYHYELCARITEMGGDPTEISYTDLLQEIKRYAIVGLYKAAAHLHLNYSQPEEVPNWWNSIDTMEVVGKLDYEIGDFNDYKIRMRDVILDYVEKGYFDFIKEKK